MKVPKGFQWTVFSVKNILWSEENVSNINNLLIIDKDPWMLKVLHGIICGRQLNNFYFLITFYFLFTNY